MTLPGKMTNRWNNRAEPQPGQGTVYWHMLMKDQPDVADLARQARERLAPFGTGLHMTPPAWLHMTALMAGPAEGFTANQLQQMTDTASGLLADLQPVGVTVGRILYHPEAIMLGVTPVRALQPIHDAAMQATKHATGGQEPDLSPWVPHITICYSTSDQPAQPLIDALGMQLPGRDIQISALHLVVQHGPERSWDWSIIDTIRLAGAVPDLASHVS